MLYVYFCRSLFFCLLTFYCAIFLIYFVFLFIQLKISVFVAVSLHLCTFSAGLFAFTIHDAYLISMCQSNLLLLYIHGIRVVCGVFSVHWFSGSEYENRPDRFSCTAFGSVCLCRNCNQDLRLFSIIAVVPHFFIIINVSFFFSVFFPLEPIYSNTTKKTEMVPIVRLAQGDFFFFWLHLCNRKLQTLWYIGNIDTVPICNGNGGKRFVQCTVHQELNRLIALIKSIEINWKNVFICSFRIVFTTKNEA